MTFDEDDDDDDLACDSPKEPATKDRVGDVQRKDRHSHLRHKQLLTFSLFSSTLALLLLGCNPLEPSPTLPPDQC